MATFKSTWHDGQSRTKTSLVFAVQGMVEGLTCLVRTSDLVGTFVAREYGSQPPTEEEEDFGARRIAGERAPARHLKCGSRLGTKSIFTLLRASIIASALVWLFMPPQAPCQTIQTWWNTSTLGANPINCVRHADEIMRNAHYTVFTTHVGIYSRIGSRANVAVQIVCVPTGQRMDLSITVSAFSMDSNAAKAAIDDLSEKMHHVPIQIDPQQ
jgi:hypothetical protein